MKTLHLSLFLFCTCASATLFAQTRYLNAVFTDADIAVDMDQLYAYNTSIQAFPISFKQPLKLDVYRPDNDTATQRPLVIYLHTGNFLLFKNPSNGTPGFNGLCSGTVRDSSVVEACTRLAKMGYVAAAVDYRLGWNPLAPSDKERFYFLTNAIYRGIQDVHTAIRFFKKSVREMGNPWAIDTSKIVLWGEGSGGVIALNANFLDDYQKIPGASNGKLLWDHDQNPATPREPMIVESINGNLYATSIGLKPATTDTLCHINHTGYSSDFQLVVNLSGYCLDTAWVDPGQAPLISFHTPYEAQHPYGERFYIVIPHLFVEIVQGSYTVQHLLDAYGNNTVFTSQNIPELQTEQQAAFTHTPALNGNDWNSFSPALYPFLSAISPPVSGAPYALQPFPWEWTDVIPGNPGCNLNKQAALLYWDTIMKFYAPRACFALGLQICIDQVLSGKEQPVQNIDVLAAPTPATSEIRFTTEEEILAVQVYDRRGRLVRNVSKLENTNYTLHRDGLNTGLYVVKLSFKTGFVTKIVSFE